MATPPVLEFEALLGPIEGDQPAGEPVPLPTRELLDRARKTIDPDDFDTKDPARPDSLKPAEWPYIIESTHRILVESSKDLMIAARLLEALTQSHGLVGLRDGLGLLRRLIEECWDRIRPVIEEPDDIEARAAAFIWLDDPDRGSRFPLTIRSVPIVSTPRGSIAWMDWDLVRSGRGKFSAEELDQAITAATREACATAVEDIDGAIEELRLLHEVLGARMGEVAPGMTSIRQAVFDCQTLARQFLDRKGPAPEEFAEEGGADGDGAGGGASPGGRSMNSRAEVYRRLTEAAEVLARLEPHSPIPFLIRRAVALGDLTFPDLIKSLISDAAVLNDMARNLGIQELRE